MNGARFAGILTMVKIVKHPGEDQGGPEGQDIWYLLLRDIAMDLQLATEHAV